MLYTISKDFAKKQENRNIIRFSLATAHVQIIISPLTKVMIQVTSATQATNENFLNGVCYKIELDTKSIVLMFDSQEHPELADDSNHHVSTGHNGPPKATTSMMLYITSKIQEKQESGSKVCIKDFHDRGLSS